MESNEENNATVDVVDETVAASSNNIDHDPFNIDPFDDKRLKKQVSWGANISYSVSGQDIGEKDTIQIPEISSLWTETIGVDDGRKQIDTPINDVE